MKKFFAIAMLVLLLFNLGGYTLLFQYFIYRSDASIIENINQNHYHSKDLVEVKIPVHLVIDDWKDFALLSGTIHLKDNSYNYAELKMTKDTMYLLCIPNTAKSRLIKANNIYAKQVSDIPLNKESHTTAIKKSINDIQCNYSASLYKNMFFEENLKSGYYHYESSPVINRSIQVQGQPPEIHSILS